jgi:hypothetical protein
VVFPLDSTKVGRWSYKNKCGARVYDTIGKARTAKSKFGNRDTVIIEVAQDKNYYDIWKAKEVNP